MTGVNGRTVILCKSGHDHSRERKVLLLGCGTRPNRRVGAGPVFDREGQQGGRDRPTAAGAAWGARFWKNSGLWGD